MIALRRPEFTANNHFSFSIPLQKANDDPERSAEAQFITWAEGIKVGRDCPSKSGAWARRSPRIYNHHGGSEEKESRWLQAKEDDDSKLPSPRMWERKGTPTARGKQQPTSRAQLIARYRQEMLDLVRDMPESDHELSLKDLVELPRTERSVAAAPPAKGTKRRKEQKAGAKKGKTMSRRSDSINSRVFLLKMFFPFSFGGRRGRSSSSGAKCSMLSKPI